jgi:hypothetical protein
MPRLEIDISYDEANQLYDLVSAIRQSFADRAPGTWDVSITKQGPETQVILDAVQQALTNYLNEGPPYRR